MIKLYTVNELAQVLKVSVRTLRREMDEGVLKFIKIRGRIRIREEDVRARRASPPRNPWPKPAKSATFVVLVTESFCHSFHE